MINLNFVSSIGLIADIVGVLLLFKYGLPSRILNHGGSLLLEESDDEESARNRYNKNVERWAYIGLVLILVGFVLQLIGTNIVL